MKVIKPVSSKYRNLSFSDFFVLWSDLGIGLLVLLAGAFLIPSLSFPVALISIIIGTVLGTVLLSLVGFIGTQYALPTMFLTRSPLGVRGSYLPTVINILQMIGWAIFEIIIMSYSANAITTKLFGFNHYHLWVLGISIAVVLLGISGPMVVVKNWLKKFAFWIMLLTSIWLSYRIFSTIDIVKLIHLPGKGDLPFFQAIDLVIAMPISWIPVVADYNRFGKEKRRAFFGTFTGFSLTNIWFYTLGALMSFGTPLAQTPKEFVTALLLTFSLPAFLIILVDELDNAWADIYSATISLQNIFPFIKENTFILITSLISFLIAMVLDITQYSNFLLIISSLLVPLFGIFIAHYFFVHKKVAYVDLLKRKGRYWYFHGVHIKGMIAWAIGVFVYQYITYKFPAIGASIPSLAVSFLLYLLLTFKKNEGKQKS